MKPINVRVVSAVLKVVNGLRDQVVYQSLFDQLGQKKGIDGLCAQLVALCQQEPSVMMQTNEQALRSFEQ